MRELKIKINCSEDTCHGCDFFYRTIETPYGICELFRLPKTKFETIFARLPECIAADVTGKVKC